MVTIQQNARTRISGNQEGRKKNFVEFLVSLGVFSYRFLRLRFYFFRWLKCYKKCILRRNETLAEKLFLGLFGLLRFRFLHVLVLILLKLFLCEFQTFQTIFFSQAFLRR